MGVMALSLTLTSDNFTREGRTGSNDSSFRSEGDTESEHGHYNIIRGRGKNEVKGQFEVKGHADAGRRVNRNGAPANLGRHSVLVLCKKNREKHGF